MTPPSQTIPNNSRWQKADRTALAVGRVLLASLFILAALNKMANYDATGVRMAVHGLQPTALLLPLTIALELLGGLSVAFAVRYAFVGAALLAVFTLATNVVFHQFWVATPEIRPLEFSLFFKNIAITGALIYFAANSCLEFLQTRHEIERHVRQPG
jgi:putative oxidoreductase